MKLAYLVNVFPTLSETFILNEIIELIKRGHDVQIFSLSHPLEDLFHDEVHAYNSQKKKEQEGP